MSNKSNIAIFIALALLVLVIAGCSSANNPAQATQNTGQPPSTGSKIPAAIKLSDSQYAPYAHLISGDTLDDAAQQAMSGFSMQKTANPDGSTTIALSSSNPEYQNQTYTLQPGQQLYFVERTLGDDGNNQEGAIGDDSAIIVDSQGYIVQASAASAGFGFRGNRTGFGGNLTDAQRQQLLQQRIDACSGKSVSDPCSMTTPRGQSNGTCQTQNNSLACMFQRPPRPSQPPA